MLVGFLFWFRRSSYLRCTCNCFRRDDPPPTTLSTTTPWRVGLYTLRRGCCPSWWDRLLLNLLDLYPWYCFGCGDPPSTSSSATQKCVWASPPPQGGVRPYKNLWKWWIGNLTKSGLVQQALQLLSLAVLQAHCGTSATSASQNAWI